MAHGLKPFLCQEWKYWNLKMVLAADTEAWIVIIILLVYEVIEVFLWDISMDQHVSACWFLLFSLKK